MPQADAAPESPCNRVCAIEPATGYCRGCYRTLDEISFWARYTPAQRQRVMRALARRRAIANPGRSTD